MKPDPNPTPQRLCPHCKRWLWLAAYHGHKCQLRHEPANAELSGPQRPARKDEDGTE